MDDNWIEHIFQNIEQDKLTKWEENFVVSVADQWHRNRRLSDKQKETLGKIWEKQS